MKLPLAGPGSCLRFSTCGSSLYLRNPTDQKFIPWKYADRTIKFRVDLVSFFALVANL